MQQTNRLDAFVSATHRNSTYYVIMLILILVLIVLVAYILRLVMSITPFVMDILSAEKCGNSPPISNTGKIIYDIICYDSHTKVRPITTIGETYQTILNTSGNVNSILNLLNHNRNTNDGLVKAPYPIDEQGKPLDK